MIAAPIHATLAILNAGLFLAQAVVLLRRAELAYVRWYLLGALGAGIGMDALSLWQLPGAGGASWIGAHMAADLFAACCWLAFSRLYARTRQAPPGVAPGWGAVVAVAVAVGAIAASSELLARPATTSPATYVLTTPGFAVQLATLTVMILAMTRLETTLANSVHGQRWKIKFTILGAFAVLAADVFVISLGLLYHTVDLTLAPARQTGSIIGMALLLYSSVYRGGETPVTVSKRLARTSVVLFGTGAYLLFLGALGVAMNLTGTSNTRAMLLAAGIAAGIGVLILLLSDRFRRRFTRLLQQYFYREKYDYRVQWLAFTRRLTSARSREDLYRAVLLGLCETFGMGGAVLYLRENDGSALVPVRTWEIYADPPRLDIPEGTLERIAGQPAIDLDREPATDDAAALEFFEKSKARFAVPLGREGGLDGLILLASPIDEKENYTQEDFDLMEALASQAYSAILNFRLADLLSLARDMEVFGKVSAFIVHDLKNLVYTLSLVTENAKRYIEDPEFQQDMIRTLENTVSKMHVLITQLRQLPTRDTLALGATELGQLVRDTFRHIPLDGLEIRGEAAMALVDRTQMQKVVLNLVRNAREASRDGQPVVVETGTDDRPFFRVVDSGCGMSERFIGENLFQAFRTTKAKGMGIGLYQCKHIVEAHGGSIEVASAPGRGTAFTVRLPAPEPPPGSEEP